MTRQHLIAAFATLALIATAGPLTAGPLTPPVGPVAPTGKTTQEVFDKVAAVESRIAINATNTPGDADSLFKITVPGSYYVTGNVTGVVGKHGIEITAGNVTLDLGGFTLTGFTAMGNFDGVSVTTPALGSITVLNGSFRNWGDDGVDLGTWNAVNCRIEGVHVVNSVGNGVVTGFGTIVSNCSASFNDVSGISTADNCVVLNCITFYNSINGIVTGPGSAVSYCSAYANTVSGIATSLGSTVVNCSAYNNSGGGISVSGGCAVSNCTAYSNTGDGITALDGSTVTSCTVNNNEARGIGAANGCQITRCTTRNNALDGISVNFSSTVTGNTCNGDGTAAGNQGGIRVLGQANRIEGNNVTYADRGLLVDSGGNVIIRNTVKGCTLNWSIVAGNAYGAIVATPAGAAVSGNTAAAALGTTDPDANFTY